MIKSLIEEKHLNFLSGKYINEEDQRQARIFNTVLIGLIAVSLLTAGSSFVRHLSHQNIYGGVSMQLVSLLFLCTLGIISRWIHYKVASYIMVLILYVIMLIMFFKWSIDLPMALLLGVFLTTLAGSVLGNKAALIMTGLNIIALVCFGIYQDREIFVPDTAWKSDAVEAGDAIGFSGMMLLISLIVWRSNNDIAQSLERARRSERLLRKEKDRLQDMVISRTKALEIAQIERMKEVQKFAEFGRISAGVIHDLSSPIMTASICLDQVVETRRVEMLKQARDSIKRIEDYIHSARKQLQGKSIKEELFVREQLKEVIWIVSGKARSKNISIELTQDLEYRIYGDSSKFHQLILNLLVNAIDAYEKESILRKVLINVTSSSNNLSITVKDYGKGISQEMIGKIFNPFYTSKNNEGRGLGIGLFIVKDIAKEHFSGSIEVTSSKTGGTSFSVMIPMARNPNSLTQNGSN